MGKRPTAFILRKKRVDGAWSEYDYLLAEALGVLESEYCPTCGQPLWLCHAESEEIQFKVRDEHCYASERIARQQQRNSENKGFDDAGVNLVAIPYSTTGRPLSDYRDPYYRALIEKHKAPEDNGPPES